MFMIKKLLVVFYLLVLFSCSTGKKEFTPKPKGFGRIDFPKHEYQLLTDEHPFSFEYSKAAIVQPDTFGKAEPHWIIIYYPKYDARIQLTYKALNGDMRKLQAHIDDAFKLASKHHVKANSQKESLIQTKSGQKAMLIELNGEVPSHLQFYATDTSKHYLRGALYLMEPTLNDSLLPVVQYMKQDCMHLIETLTWK